MTISLLSFRNKPFENRPFAQAKLTGLTAIS